MNLSGCYIWPPKAVPHRAPCGHIWGCGMSTGKSIKNAQNNGLKDMKLGDANCTTNQQPVQPFQPSPKVKTGCWWLLIVTHFSHLASDLTFLSRHKCADVTWMAAWYHVSIILDIFGPVRIIVIRIFYSILCMFVHFESVLSAAFCEDSEWSHRKAFMPPRNLKS